MRRVATYWLTVSALWEIFALEERRGAVRADLGRPAGPVGTCLLHFLAQLRLPDLVQRFLRRQRHFGHVVPECVFDQVQVGLGGLLPQDVGAAACVETSELTFDPTPAPSVCFARRFQRRSLTGEHGQDEDGEELHGWWGREERDQC